ncbi:MAG: DUF2781 domain-containing protein [Alphaproteobacteria bacterium]|nr:DUF2781 domain-containing protein [Alphaproteobacteria bacterium]
MTVPLRQRPLDAVLAATYAGFVCSTFTVDVWAVTGWIHGDDPLARALALYTGSFDPLFGVMPFYVWAVMLVSVLFFGPMDLAIVYALIRGRAWIRTPALFVSGMQFCCMVCYFVFQAMGPHPPRSWPVVIAANGPYLLAPVVLSARLWKGRGLS